MSLCAPTVPSLVNSFGPRRVLFAGTTAVVCGLLLTSWTGTVWQIFLTYGIFVGVGCSLLWMTALSLLPHYFERRLLVACSVAVTGWCLGVACLSPVTRIVMKLYGWRRMLQLSALVGVPMLICVPLFRPSKSMHPQEVRLVRRVVNCCKLQKNVRLSVYLWLTSLYCTATYIPTTYIVSKLSVASFQSVHSVTTDIPLFPYAADRICRSGVED